jgi:HEAT repeat protein
MKSTGPLVDDFFGTDPLRGEDAAIALVHQLGPAAIEALIPLQGAIGSLSRQTEVRLKSVALRVGPTIAPYLSRVIAEGSWLSKGAAALCYAGFDDGPEIEAPLLAILQHASDFDAERMAVDALTQLGADGCAWDLVAYAKRGVWRPGAIVDPAYVSEYPFEKLSSYVLEAIARFVANAKSRDRADSLFRLLTDLIELREQHFSNHTPSSYDVVARHTERFTGWAIEPMMALWGSSPNQRLQFLCLETLYKVASLEAADFLLKIAIDPHRPDSIRRSASIALGELRHPDAARILADALRNPSTDRAHLDWAFSALYAVPSDWPDLEVYIEELLDGSPDVSARLFHSLALRGEHRIASRLAARLNAGNAFERWTSALSLARLIGAESRPLLEDRLDEAGHDLEQCGFLAAMARLGDTAAAERLHHRLQLTRLSRVPDIWASEILDAFHVPSGFDQRAFRVWSDAAGINPRKFQYLEALAVGTPPQRASTPSAIPPPTQKRKLFISYSHKDGDWLQRFVTMLRPLLDSSSLEIWEDTRIVAGQWRPQIDQAMRDSRAALFLVSSHFLASDFITRTELPELVRYATEEGRVTIVWALLDDCLWERSPLKDYQGDNIDQPLTILSPGEQSRAIKKTCLRIEHLLSAP